MLWLKLIYVNKGIIGIYSTENHPFHLNLQALHYKRSSRECIKTQALYRIFALFCVVLWSIYPYHINDGYFIVTGTISRMDPIKAAECKTKRVDIRTNALHKYHLCHRKPSMVTITTLSLLVASVVYMMTSSNGIIFSVTGSLCGEFTGPQWIPLTKANDAELWSFYDLCLNKRLSKQSWGWWYETPSRPLRRHCNKPTPRHHLGQRSWYHDNSAISCHVMTPCPSRGSWMQDKIVYIFYDSQRCVFKKKERQLIFSYITDELLSNWLHERNHPPSNKYKYGVPNRVRPDISPPLVDEDCSVSQ